MRALNEIAASWSESGAISALARSAARSSGDLALIGASRPEQVIENAGALKNLSFSAEDFSEIDWFAQEAGSAGGA